MTKDEYNRLRTIDILRVITSDDKIVLPGIHFCPDWDYLPVYDKSPEKECCTCKTIKDKQE